MKGLAKACGITCGVVAILGVIGVVLTLMMAEFAPSTNQGTPRSTSEATGAMPEIVEFLEEHSEFGAVASVQEVPAWAYGPRQMVRTTRGRSLLFYVKDGKVVSVYGYNADGIREPVWRGNTNPEEYIEEDVERAASDGLPAYVVLFKNKTINVPAYADILVESYSRETLVDERERTLRAIVEREDVDFGTLYSTREAAKANFNESFFKEHPDALRVGLLGTLQQDGTFIPGEEHYP